MTSAFGADRSNPHKRGFKMKEKQKASIKNWYVEKSYDSREFHSKTYFLVGDLISHPDPHFNDGHEHRVRTSKLIRIDFEKKIAETMNSIYELL